MAYRILFRRDTSANWATNNPVLSAGEPGFTTDTNIFKIGDGVTAWSSIQEINPAGITGPAGATGATGAVNFNNIASDVIASANATYDLGTQTYQWNDLYVAGSMYLGSSTVTLSSSGANFILAGGTGNQITGNLEISGDLTVNGIGITGASVATQGTSLYSTNPATSNFNTQDGIYLGLNAGNGTNNQKNVMIGYYAGYNAVGAYNSNFIGVSAGDNTVNCNKAVFIGHRAGNNSSGCQHGVFIGRYTGSNSTGSYDSNFFGNYAGYNASNAYSSNFFGPAAGQSSTGNNVNAFGSNAGVSNALSGQTIFSNSSLPTFADHTAAAAAITVLLGASANSTYLYHNQSTDSIGAVRL